MGMDKVPQLGTVGNAIAEWMIALQVLLEPTALTRFGDQLQLQRLIQGQWSVPNLRRLVMRSHGRAVRAVRLSSPQSGQRRQAILVLPSTQPLGAFAGFQLSILPPPLQ